MVSLARLVPGPAQGPTTRGDGLSREEDRALLKAAYEAFESEDWARASEGLARGRSGPAELDVADHGLTGGARVG